ncbi:FxsA family protein [Thermoleophilia bacterium SCSIO 60948]|nr:FxsA family protein [Thermoleophilia bacterium SCSIO 60948]
MPLLLLILFIGLPIAEIYVIVQVGQAIGILPTLAILLIDGFVGAALARSQGRTAWRRFNETMSRGRIPANEAFDGAMIVLGGSLLLAPGFITDIFGLAFLVPPTRALIKAGLRRLAKSRAIVFSVGLGGGSAGGPGRPGPAPGPAPGFPPRRRPEYDYEGSAREVDSDPRLDEGER